VHVAPGHLDLELLPETAASPGASRRLLVALTGVVDAYDLVLLDCPPSLRGHLVDLAWTATDLVWIPTEPEYDSIEAARRVLERVAMDRDLLNPDMQVGGLVVSRYRQSLGVHQQRAVELAAVLPGGVCPWRIPELAVLKSLVELAVPLAGLSTGGGPMRVVAREVFQWMLHRASQIASRPASRDAGTES
jgi:cellulose biosynthesis protein BcsQ